MKAIWNGEILAESADTISVEGNFYFPMSSANRRFLMDSNTHTMCHWKGTASYFDVVVNGEINKDAAWFYPNPSSLADKIKNYVAFWKGIVIEK